MLVSILAVPMLAFAQEKGPIETCGWDFFCYGSMLFNWASLAIGNLISYVAGFLITIAAALIQVLITLGSQIMSSVLVREGFRLTLSLTNLGFVMAIIAIAFGTMLRLESYGLKQMLWKLVAAALLVNFSFTFAGIIIDFFNVFGNYFIQAASPGDIGNFAANMANALNVSSLSGVKVAVPENLGGDILKFGLSYVSSFVSVASTAIFMTVLTITFFAVAFMLLVRHIYLMFLLIVMPLAWLLWIFPNVAGLNKKWWETFIQWNLFFPLVSFVLYLSILTSKKVGEVVTLDSAGSAVLKGAASVSGLAESTLISFLQIIIQVGFIFGGLIMAQSLKVAGANTAMSMANSAKGWIMGATGKAARTVGGGLVTGGIYAASRGKVLETSPAKAGANALANLLNKPALRWIPGSKAAVAGLNVAASRSKEVEDYQKQALSSLTPQQWDAMKMTTPVGPIAQAAMLAEAVKRKDVGGLTDHLVTPDDKDKRIEQFIQASRKVNPGIADTEATKKNIDDVPNVKEVLATNPRLNSKLTGKTLRKIAEGMRADKAADVEVNMFSENEFVLGLSPASISDIYRRGTAAQRAGIKKALKETVGQDLNTILEEMTKTDKLIAEAKRVGDNDKVKDLKADLKFFVQGEKDAMDKLRAAGNIDALNAYKKLKFAQQNIGDDE